MLNRIILEGRLGADPERRETSTGRVVARLSLPLFNPYQKDGDPTEWVQCEVWNQPADFISKYGKKGHLVSVEGRLRNQRYTDKDGNTRYRNYVSVDRVTLLEPRNRQENAAPTAPPPAPSSSSSPSPSSPPAPSPETKTTDTTSIDDLFKDFDGIMNG